ncbi:MAG: carnitine 3-dehydrogenase [Pseudomonadota bacterium]
MRVAVVGGGVIGGGWIARFVLNGLDVAVFDPDPEAARKIADVLDNARAAYAKLTLAPPLDEGNWHLCDSLEVAVGSADLVVEAVPERLDIKHQVYAKIQAQRPEAIIASSTSGFKPSDLQKDAPAPGRIIVAHPFNPVYLLPLVEVVGGPNADQAVLDAACAFYAEIGMHPLVIRAEIDAFLADRFLEAVWREALWLVKDGIATTAEIDDAIRYGFGLRWAQMGLFETYRVAGGEAGMRHFISQFGPALKWPWTKLMDVPELTEDLIDTIARQSDAQSGAYSIRELERIRDTNLVAILQALKGQNWGAGATLQAYEDKLYARAHSRTAPDLTGPLRLVERAVLPDWVDYNGHMTESRYLQVFGDCTDALLALIGCDASYHTRGLSYYTVETHIQHLGEVAGGVAIYTTTQVLAVDEKRLHLWHQIHRRDDDHLLATAEQMLLHVNTQEGRACPADANVLGKAREIAAAHANLPVPQAKGRYVGERR